MSDLGVQGYDRSIGSDGLLVGYHLSGNPLWLPKSYEIQKHTLSYHIRTNISEQFYRKKVVYCYSFIRILARTRCSAEDGATLEGLACLWFHKHRSTFPWWIQDREQSYHRGQHLLGLFWKHWDLVGLAVVNFKVFFKFFRSLP